MPGWLARMSRLSLKAPAHISSVSHTAGAYVRLACGCGDARRSTRFRVLEPALALC